MLSRRETGSKRCKTDPNTRKGGLFGAVGGNCLIFPYALQRQARRCAKRAAVPSASLRRCTTAPSMPQRQTRHGARLATTAGMPPRSPQHQAQHPAPHSCKNAAAPSGLRRQCDRSCRGIGRHRFFLSTKITENTWKSGLRCDKIEIWI